MPKKKLNLDDLFKQCYAVKKARQKRGDYGYIELWLRGTPEEIEAAKARLTALHMKFTIMKPPQRITLSRKRGWRMPHGAVKVDRSTRWGNPFRITPLLLSVCKGDKEKAQQAVVNSFRDWLGGCDEGRAMAENAKAEIRGKSLACWCGIWICPNCGTKYDEREMRNGMQCINNLSHRGHGAWRCHGRVHRVPCHADVLLEIANA